MRSTMLRGVAALVVLFGAAEGVASAQEAAPAVEQKATPIRTVEATETEAAPAAPVEAAAPASTPVAPVEAKASAPAEAVAPAPTAAPAPAPMSGPPAAMGWFGMGVRFGYRGDSLVAGDVPVVGGKLQEQLDKINEKSPVDPVYTMEDLNLDGAVFEIVPTFHLGGDGFFTKFDLPIGLSSDLTTFGLGFYPLAFGYHIESLGLFPYAQVGSVFTYAMAKQFTPANGSAIPMNGQGILLESRVAVGLKYFLISHLPVTVELGYSPFALGAVIDQERLDAMAGVPDAPGSYLRGGKGSVLGLTAGLEWL